MIMVQFGQFQGVMFTTPTKEIGHHTIIAQEVLLNLQQM